MEELETARFQWLDGERRLARATDGRPAMEAVTESLVAELRRRLGGPFTAAELARLYYDGTEWCMDVAMNVAPQDPRAWDGSTVADAAFGRYLREASDYAGGRIVAPMEDELRT